METAELNADVVTNIGDESVNFSPAELKLFVREIADMLIAGESINVEKAIHNAKYFAEIDRRLENVSAGKKLISFTPEEWEKFSNAHNV